MTIYGLDTLLVGHYKSVALHNWPLNFAGGAFALEGGDIYEWVDNLLATGKCPAFRGQLVWHGTHLYSDSDIPNITHLSQRYEQLALKYPDKKIYLSPFCEAKNIATPDRYLNIVAHNAPHCIPVWCSINGVYSHKYMNEVHGGGPPLAGNYIRSGDGGIKVGASQHDDIDLDITHEKEKHSSCEIFFIWNCDFNGHYSMNDKPTSIDKRTGWPAAKDFHAAAYLATERGNVHMDNHWLLKSNSELHGPNDDKGNKLMFIAPIHSDKVVLKRHGKVVDILHRVMPDYVDGRARYYSQHQGWEIGANVEVWIDGKQHGNVNCGFRTGN